MLGFCDNQRDEELVWKILSQVTPPFLLLSPLAPPSYLILPQLEGHTKKRYILREVRAVLRAIAPPPLPGGSIFPIHLG